MITVPWVEKDSPERDTATSEKICPKLQSSSVYTDFAPNKSQDLLIRESNENAGLGPRGYLQKK